VALDLPVPETCLRFVLVVVFLS